MSTPDRLPRAALPSDPVERAVREAVFACLRRARAGRPDADASYGDLPIPRYDGGTDRAGRRHAPIWPRFVDLMRARGIRRPAQLAEALAAAAYEADVAAGHAPRPDHLLDPRAVARLDACLEAWARDPAAEARDAAALFRDRVAVLVRCRGVPPAAAVARVVLDPDAGWDALTRCCLAYAAGRRDLAGRLLPDAAAEYALDPEGARAGWGPLLPPGVERRAPEARRHDPR